MQTPQSLDVDAASENQAREHRPNHVYPVGALGHIYAYTSYPRGRIAATRAILQISLTGEAITTVIDGKAYRSAVYITHPVWLEIDSGSTPVVCFVFYTYGDMFRSMRLLHEPLITYSRELFQPFDRDLSAAIGGELSVDAAKKLFMDIIAVLAAVLPPAPPADPRVEHVLAMLEADSNIAIRELAKAVSLSPDRLSHLFTESVGISLRRQRLAIKLQRSLAIYRPGMSMKEVAKAAGFSDTAHMSRTSTETLGASPTYSCVIPSFTSDADIGCSGSHGQAVIHKRKIAIDIDLDSFIQLHCQNNILDV